MQLQFIEQPGGQVLLDHVAPPPMPTFLSPATARALSMPPVTKVNGELRPTQSGGGAWVSTKYRASGPPGGLPPQPPVTSNIRPPMIPSCPAPGSCTQGTAATPACGCGSGLDES